MVARPAPPPSLMETLRQYRTDQAYQRAIPPATVFSNKLLSSIVSARPNTLTALLKLHGIGPTRCQNYGRDIVRFVNLDSKGRRVKDKMTAIRAARKPEAKGRMITKESRGTLRARTTAKKARKAKKPAKTIGPLTQTTKIVTSRFFPLPGREQVPQSAQIILPRRLPFPKTSVYILELDDGRVYVGSSKDVPRRLSQHAAGSGSAYTRLYRPTGVQLPRLGNVEGDGDAAERDETLRYMMLRGVPFVRGWKFARVNMPPEEYDEAEANIRELFDLCRRCGYKGHFCTHCRATFDRLGRPVG